MSVVTGALKQVNWQDKHVMVACSGGVDSMTLLHALVQSGVKPVVLHINYQLRGAESDLDEALVVQTAKALGLDYNVYKCPVSVTKSKGVNLQSAAREFRRKFFLDWTTLSENHMVALAHHRDDQVETFFLQLFRGSGIFGLGGMHPEKAQIARPFLEISKAQILEYATANAIPWRQDASNNETVYLRNLFRKELLLHLYRDQPSLAENCLLLMQQFRNMQAELLKSIASLKQQWLENQSLSIAGWNQLSTEQKVAFVQAVQWPSWTLERLEQLVNGSVGKQFKFAEITVVKQKEHVAYYREMTAAISDFEIEELSVLPQTFDKDAVYLDPAKITGELVLRRWTAGDRIKSIGMQGSQLVSDILKDAGIPLMQRKQIVVLADQEHILWIPGIKISRVALADSQQDCIWKITQC